MMRERWRIVVGFPVYAVSDIGRVKRIVESAKGHPAGRVMRQHRNNQGYSYVTLASLSDSKKKLVSRLVCEAFHGPPPTEDYHAAHGDGDPSNNKAGNLRWATRTENMADCLLHGTRATGARHGRTTKPERTPRGENHGSAKLNAKIIREIRDHPRTVGSGVLLARRFSVSPSLICQIRKRKAWSHI